jgi:putative oxidoreductase
MRNPDRAIAALRVLLAGLIAAHGWTRYLSGGWVFFGQWLEQGGWPYGHWIAAAITACEILGTPLLALGWRRVVSWLCLGYAFIYVMGIVLVHAPEGWFVVGAGRNGMEYSVLLVACLLAVAWTHWPPARRRKSL